MPLYLPIPLFHSLACLLACSSSCQIEAKTRHTTPVLSHQVLASFLWIGGGGEEHAFVAGGFLVFADTAGLYVKSANSNSDKDSAVERICAGWVG